MAATATGGARAVVLSQPVTFVTGNAKKLEEVRAILGNSIPFRSLKLDRTFQIHALRSLLMRLSLISLYVTKLVPELQGEPEEISKEKARLAAKEVRK